MDAIASIELAYTSNQPLSGLTADIEKAYNCLLRWPVLCAARFAGTPSSCLNGWAPSPRCEKATPWDSRLPQGQLKDVLSVALARFSLTT